MDRISTVGDIPKRYSTPTDGKQNFTAWLKDRVIRGRTGITTRLYKEVPNV